MPLTLKLARWFTAAAGAYEAYAILTGKVPTISALCWRARKSKVGRFLLWMGLGYLADHLLRGDLS